MAILDVGWVCPAASKMGAGLQIREAAQEEVDLNHQGFDGTDTGIEDV
jgi:hypothetical protein